MKILSFDPRKNKQVLCGEFEAGTFFRDVKAKHFMRVVGGYGIQEDAFQRIMELGVNRIVVRVLPTHDVWESVPKDWLDHCHVADYGSGKQRFLSLTYMQKKHE